MNLTDDDKHWMSELMDQKLGRHAQQMDQKMLLQAQQLDQKLILLAQQLDQKLVLQAQQFNERLEQVETSLLTAFHKWASPMEMRQRSHTAVMRAFDAEMEALSDRVTKLEGSTATE